MKNLFYFIVFISLISCKKGKADFVLTGKITDQTFSQALTGATVKLYQVPVGTTQELLIETTTLGNDGMYSFTFPRDKMEKYIIKVFKTNYFEIEETVYFSSLSIDEDNVRDYGTTAKSWVKLTFFNSSPSPSDELQYIKQAGKEGCFECCGTSMNSLYGAVDTSIYCINDGNTEYSYFYEVIGTSNIGIKSTYTIPFDTTEIILNY